MTPFRAIVLGIVQGLTEFVPVSSSGHLILTRWALGWRLGPPGVEKAFDVALHAGTLVGVVAYLRSDLRQLLDAVPRLLRRQPERGETRFLWFVAVATVPAALTGALFEDFVADRLGTPSLVAAALIVFAGVLAVADRQPATRSAPSMRTRDAVVVGVAQAVALQPGVSRSGATMAAARALGFERSYAARLSFLMSVPLIAGATVYEATALTAASVDRETAVAMTIGAVAAAVTSIAAIRLVLGVVATWTFRPFVIYRLALGALVLIVGATR